MWIIGNFASSILKSISDTFTRVTTSILGTSDTGNVWSNLVGTWYANGSAAKSDDAGSSRSIASVDFGSTDMRVAASVSSGTGVAGWISAANSWWASAYVQQNYSTPFQYPCSDCYYNACKTCSSYTCAGACGYLTGGSADTMNCSCNNAYTQETQIFGCNANSYTYNYCLDSPVACGTGTSRCVRYTSVPATTNCACGNAVAGTDPNNCGCCCNAGYDCYTSSCTGYNNGTNHFLTLIKSVGGTVSEASGSISLGQAAAAIVLQTSGDTVTSKAYSDTAKTAQIGSTISVTATNPSKGTSMGVIKVASDNQSNTVDNFIGDRGE